MDYFIFDRNVLVFCCGDLGRFLWDCCGNVVLGDVLGRKICVVFNRWALVIIECFYIKIDDVDFK